MVEIFHTLCRSAPLVQHLAEVVILNAEVNEQESKRIEYTTKNKIFLNPIKQKSHIVRQSEGRHLNPKAHANAREKSIKIYLATSRPIAYNFKANFEKHVKNTF